MKILKNIFLIIFIFPCVAFSVNLEISFGGGVGGSMEFSYTEGLDTIPSENGSRLDSGLYANAFLDIGANFDIKNMGALNSVSILFETGYNYYMRYRTQYKDEDIAKYNHLAEYKDIFYYHNLILGILPKLNFNNGISFGIGFGIYIPLYSTVKREGKDAWGEEITTGLGKYVGINRFNFEKISYMYKVPIMPYIKLNLEKNFYISDSWAFKIGGNILYNFGMEFDMDKLKSDTTTYGYNKYKFSSLVFELFFGFGFGRPKYSIGFKLLMFYLLIKYPVEMRGYFLCIVIVR